MPGQRVGSRPWPQVVGVVALIVLGGCAVVVVANPDRLTETTGTSASLASRSNWDLATALPTSADFPAEWGYSLAGRLQRAKPLKSVASSERPNSGPAATYAPAPCASVPRLLDHSGGALAAYAQVDRYAQVVVRDAVPIDAAATGEGREHGPNARFAIWAVPDGPARIANYLKWLDQCSSYRVTNYFRDGQVKDERTVTTVVETRSAAGADAAAAVTRTFTNETGPEPTPRYHVAYYAVRGIVLECTVYMEGADLDLVTRLGTATLHKLGAL
ncbi:hypothetical protein [Mycobacterium spongiae]|uniref:PknH-like extracellular domain-containing protein n=1 Tax=Mycobacterium spongiae TaxID=886343 RepID=A0A975PXF6_9MYCO|nr:hypothetical protein [Mycobacterium spongiae]QUR67708.1 hypothetical protein F6B93_11895 [Mycobacterium spongiae]